VEIMALLDRLEELISQATKVPLTHKILLDPEEVLALADEMRDLMPQEIRDASRVSSQKDSILQEAREMAEASLREAKGLATQLTSEAAVTKEAQQQADELIDQAKRVAREIRQNAMEWADDLFSRVQPDLERVSMDSQKAALAVRKARDELRQQL
jgi:vacuolar-type H+-ATPase subunit H